MEEFGHLLMEAVKVKGRDMEEADDTRGQGIGGLPGLHKQVTILEEAEQDLPAESQRLSQLSEMAREMVHDLNNALGVILGRAQLALEDTVDPQLMKHLQTIEQTVMDATVRVRRFQHLSRATMDGVFEAPVGSQAIENLGTVEAEQTANKDSWATPTKPAAILLVDDDPNVLDAIGLMLERLGYAVTGAVSGQEAIEAFGKSRHDLVISDVGMPHMSGYDVAKAVKQINPNTPVALLSAWGLQLDQEKALYVDTVIAKPVKKDALSEQIGKLLR